MTTEQRTISLPEARLEIFVHDGPASAPMVSAAHPVDFFGATTADILAAQTRTGVVCVNPNAGQPTTPLELQVDRIEAVRKQLGIASWIFWGMSGGGWLAQIYAHRYPQALRGIVVESACLCFRERLRDPQCVLSPNFPAWHDALQTAGLLGDANASSENGEWATVEGVGQVFRARGGPAILVSPGELAPAMRDAMPELLRFDARPFIRSIKTPTLVLCGTADPVVPLHCARAVADAIAGSTFVAIDGAGHTPAAEQRPEVGRTFADFVARLA